MSQTFVGNLWGLLAVTIWTGWYLYSRYGVTHQHLTAYDITALRFATAGLLLAPVAFVKGLRLVKGGWLGSFVLAAGVGAPYVLLVILGMQYAPAAQSTVFNAAMVPFFVSLIARFVFKESPSARKLAALALILGGVILIALKNLSLGVTGEWRGQLLFLSGSLLWSTYTVGVRQWQVPPFQAVSIVAVFSAIFYLPPYFLTHGLSVFSAPLYEILTQAFLQGVLTALIALAAFSRAITLLGATRASSFAAMVPVTVALLGVPLLGEVPTPLEMTGVVMASLGIYLSARAA